VSSQQCHSPISGKSGLKKNLSASIRARLLGKAKSENLDFSLLLTRYALERLLYRLSISKHGRHFVLKGALLFDLWFDMPLRPTRDIDLLGFGLAELPLVTSTFEDICSVDVEDGMYFDSQSVYAEEIRKEANYAGIRIKLIGTLDAARCAIQVDIGYGDAITPNPETAHYPVIFPELPAPQLQVYPRYTVAAEKLEAIISLGMANSRMKDYFDLWVLLSRTDLDDKILGDAIEATCTRRGTFKPKGTPLGLGSEFGNDPQKNRQWLSFIKKNQLEAPELPTIVAMLADRLVPLLRNNAPL